MLVWEERFELSPLGWKPSMLAVNTTPRQLELEPSFPPLNYPLVWRGVRDSNPRLAAYKAAAVATEPPPHI